LWRPSRLLLPLYFHFRVAVLREYDKVLRPHDMESPKGVSRQSPVESCGLLGLSQQDTHNPEEACSLRAAKNQIFDHLLGNLLGRFKDFLFQFVEPPEEKM